MIRPAFLRVLGVVMLVAGLGGLLGAFIGVVFGAVVLTLFTGRPWAVGFMDGAYSWVAAIGAAHGVGLGSAAAFTLLRHVPLWRAIGETALGASIGTALMVGLLRAGAFESEGTRLAAFLLAPAGALVAAVRLRRAVPRAVRPSHEVGAG